MGTNEMDEIARLLFGMLGNFAIVCAIYTIFRVLMCFAVYFDATARGVKDKILFTVLTFFFPIIVGIVYLCIRKKTPKIQPKICNNCRTTVNTKSTFCPNCLGVEFTDYLIPNNEKYHKNSKICLIVAALCFALYIVASFSSSNQMQKYADEFSNVDPYSYYNQYDEYDEYEEFDEFLKQFGSELE